MPRCDITSCVCEVKSFIFLVITMRHDIWASYLRIFHSNLQLKDI